MTQSNESTELVRTIVVMAHNLGMQVIAEGVETKVQLEQLRALGCEYVQGYLFSKPLPTDATPEFIRETLSLHQTLVTPALEGSTR